MVFTVLLLLESINMQTRYFYCWENVGEQRVGSLRNSLITNSLKRYRVAICFLSIFHVEKSKKSLIVQYTNYLFFMSNLFQPSSNIFRS